MKLPAFERLYQSLPAIYRQRDVAEGESLRALLGAVDTELTAFENDLDGLYDNWFIETCSEWVVPYIGDLLGQEFLHAGVPGVFSLRAFIAHTLRNRRRKGTIEVVGFLAHDLTGWTSHAVEFQRHCAMAHYLNAEIGSMPATIDMHNPMIADLVDSACDLSAHTIDVRRPGASGGKYNVPSIGLFLWRLQSYTLLSTSCRKVAKQKFTIDRLGLDRPLFNSTDTIRYNRIGATTNALLTPAEVPSPISPMQLGQELDRRQNNIWKTPEKGFFPENGAPAFTVRIGTSLSTLNTIDPKRIAVGALGKWESESPAVPAGFDMLVDPANGRLLFADDIACNVVKADWSYGFAADLGGGPYNRSGAFEELITAATFKIQVKSDPLVNADPAVRCVATLEEALTAWNLYLQSCTDTTLAPIGTIRILDSASYVCGKRTIAMPKGKGGFSVYNDTVITGADNSKLFIGADPKSDTIFPHLAGAFVLSSTVVPKNSAVIFHGLLVEGPITAQSTSPIAITVDHCTLYGSLMIDTAFQGSVVLNRTICDGISSGLATGTLTITDSIIGTRLLPLSVDGTGFDTTVTASTLLGECKFKILTATNAIFAKKVTVATNQEGALRYSYVPEDSHTPERFRCQPDLAIIALGTSTSSEDRTGVLDRMKPVFLAHDLWSPSYARLDGRTANEIATGAEDGAEMGAYNHLKEAHRIANLQLTINDYMRAQKEAGLFFVT